MQVEYIFPRYFYTFLTRFTSLEIYGAVVFGYGNVNANEIYRFFFYVQNEKSCTKHITVFSLGNSFPIALLKHHQRMKLTYSYVILDIVINAGMFWIELSFGGES